MDLLTPDSEQDDKTIRSALNQLKDAPEAIHVGVTSVGLESRWYAMSNGKIFDYDFDWDRTVSDVTEKINLGWMGWITTTPTTTSTTRVRQ